jgi:hypothetical protein
MTWLLNLAKLLPSARTMIVYALAALAASALSGWTGWRLAMDRCEASKTQSLARAIEQSHTIAQQDAEILASQATRTITIYKTTEAAHETISNATVPDCSLDADSLRAVRAVYPPLADYPAATAGPVHTADTPGGWEPAIDYSLADRRCISLSAVCGREKGAH